jgi:APA family basic amino acid/polyamine antiporter
MIVSGPAGPERWRTVGVTDTLAGFWDRKSTAELLREAARADGDAETPVFKRSLSALQLVTLGIGGIIGAGIFVLTGHAAAANAGPAVTLSFMLGAVACAFAGLCYAEMASTVPICGSAYTYAYATLGELIAWIIGWDLILEYAVGAIAVSVGWSGYFVSFMRDFGINLPQQFTSAPLAYDANSGAWSSTGAVINIPAMAIIAFVTALLVVGIRESARFTSFVVVVKLVVIALFLATAASSVSLANWVTAGNPSGALIPPNAGPGVFGWSGVVRGAAVVFFAYIGFDAISTAAQEAKTPERDMPIGILGSLVICAALYVAVGFVLTGIVPYDKLSVPDPIAVGIDAVGIGWLGPFIKLGILFGLTSVILIMRWRSRASSAPWRMTGCCRASPQGSIRASRRPMSRPSSPAASLLFSAGCCRSGWSASSSRSARCSRSPWSRSERWCCVSAIRTCRVHSGRRRSGWWRRLPLERRCS